MKLERYITYDYLKEQKRLHDLPKGYGGGGGKWAEAVEQIAKEHDCKTILDYGCGQGKLGRQLKNNGFDVTDYDPAIRGKDFIGKYNTFDIVTCTDVLEHIEPDRLPIVIDHIYSLSNVLVFLVIAQRPSNKWLLDGRNAHLTIQPTSWWLERLLHPRWEEIEPPKSPLEQKSRELVVLLKRV